MNTISYKEMIPKIGNGSVILNGSFVIGNVVIGEDSSIWFNSIIRGDVGHISIGSNSNIQDMVCISASILEDNVFNVSVGDGVSIESKVILKGCAIENNCIIGLKAIIMDGVTIGENCMVMANSFLPRFRKYPPNSLISGNPAKVVRPLTKDELRYIIDSAKLFADLKNNYLWNQFRIDLWGLQSLY